ncbi:uncharacterized protein TRAVEDRAFT_28942 [Trametes versicolor FP-101664 SS1]|uniref:uncharacterized protein n=1 Tax=Trametes versicolor (strain FP-101664) TaxID=717944 RepID=UPI0004624853|nr:uncharacterized protein TRAVEDRAFT_28942 [Trametes versicolor FP-101664 SS1]EIW58251.1 hypothetical protein TRAVEDRAFT_28942 [Trametes versicolor FP-101664 SS1]
MGRAASCGWRACLVLVDRRTRFACFNHTPYTTRDDPRSNWSRFGTNQRFERM